MGCKNLWSREFVDSFCTKIFRNSELRRHRENVLFEREKIRMPETQPDVERILAMRHLNFVLGEQRNRLVRLHNRYTAQGISFEARKHLKELQDLNAEMTQTFEDLNKLRNGATVGDHSQPLALVRKCPTEDCKGFMNEEWFCGLCKNTFCEHCNELVNDQHECDPGAVETMKLLKKDTKPCPKCGTMIHKLSGCFSPDAEILMYDGTVKTAKNITIDDKLVGDDGQMRTVLKLTNGEDDMYLIKQNKGENYIVNSEHTLVLYYAANGSIKYHESINKYKLSWFDKTFKTKNFETFDEAKAYSNTLHVDKYLNINIQDYLKLKDSSKKTLKGVKLQTPINWPNKNVELDPYILGTWLGDGYSNGKEYATNDTELLEYWISWAKNNNAEVIKTTNKYRYYIKHIHNQHNNCNYKNPLKIKLDKYNLVNNKHIPAEYICNSKDIRLKVLAGIIDTDGSVSNNGRRVSIITTIEKLSSDIVLLAKSLGFSVNVHTRHRKNENTFDKTVYKNYKTQFCINISGYNLHEIPTLLKRKKCSQQIGGVNLLTTFIEVEKLEKGQYYGWAVDGNSRFLLKDFTITKNCSQMWCPDCHTAFDWRTGRIEVGRIHNPHYIEFKNKFSLSREHGDIPCGGVPDFGELHSNEFMMSVRKVISQYNRDINFRYDEIADDDNRWLRTIYMLNDMDTPTFKKELQRRDKMREKYRDIRNIFQMFVDTAGDLLRQYVLDNSKYKEIRDILIKLAGYTNDEIRKIHNRYNCITPYTLQIN